MTGDKRDMHIHVTEAGGCVIKKEYRETGVEVTEEPNFYALLGNTVHKISEILLNSIITGNGTIPFDEAIEKAGYTNNEFYINNEIDVQSKAERLYSWLYAELEDGNLSNVRSTEETIRVDIYDDSEISILDGAPIMKLDGRDLVLTGTLDISIWIDRTLKTVEIIDLKSGKTKSKKHAWQVAAYAKLLEIKNPDISVQRCRIVYLGEDFVEKRYKNGKVTKKHERVLNRDDIEKYYREWCDALAQYITDLCDNWKSGELPEDRHSDCFFCEWKSICWGEY